MVSKKVTKSFLVLVFVLSMVLSMSACSKETVSDILFEGTDFVMGLILGTNDPAAESDVDYGLTVVNPADSTVDDNLLINWDERLAPNYYLVVGAASVPDDIPEPGTVRYNTLDELGRTQWVDGTVTWDMVKASAGWREQFSASANPSGWGHNSEQDIELWDGSYYHGWFWNRSHLLADSLGGHAERDNVITGTRMQNVGDNSSSPGGMAYGETVARNWFYDHEGDDSVWLYYRATPCYVGDELLPRSVIVDMRSYDGSIDQEIITYNYAKGYTINYYNGTFKKGYSLNSET